MPSDKVRNIEIMVNQTLADELSKLTDYLWKHWESELELGEGAVDTAIRLLEQLRQKGSK